MKILAITGKRGGYEAMLPLYRALDKDPFYDFHLIVCDQHLMPKMGLTAENIEFSYTVADPMCAGGEYSDRVFNICRYSADYIAVIEGFQPDLLLLYGDRGEIAAAIIPALEMHIPIAHFQAGDITGGIDNIYRTMISTAATYLFTSSDLPASYLMTMGIYNLIESNVYIVGDQHLDLLTREGFEQDPSVISKHLGIPQDILIGKRIALLLFHPETDIPLDCIEDQMMELLTAIHIHDMLYIAIYPCSDSGHDIVIKCLHEEAARNQKFYIYPNLPQRIFHSILFNSMMIIGNSSCGIIEAPFLQVPTVNIGNRQTGRLMSPSIMSCPVNGEAIDRAIQEALLYQGECKWHYGSGTATEKIIRVFDRLFKEEEKK